MSFETAGVVKQDPDGKYRVTWPGRAEPEPAHSCPVCDAQRRPDPPRGDRDA